MAAAAASCLTLPCKSKPFSPSSSLSNTSSRRAGFALRRSPEATSLAFASSLSLTAFPTGVGFLRPVEKPRAPPLRRPAVVCEAAPKKYDSASKRTRQAERRRIYNKARKSEIKTRMKKVLEALDVLRKKSDAQAEEILPIEKLIADAYSAIDKAIQVGTLHGNTGARRKSRLARRKKAVEIHHGWYIPAAAAA
ncbi:small ribosomal subunit protein bS20c-like [Musa acuminata AAA Group]|uniref:Small ribosomal subunit protein bS20c n=1 Tax=Musa acuminata subsp. malaccensis TaxID=214687 RepID=A0A804ITG7_MUSAM|nr:PREDICTED: 30S ribosomal protein S20, chloroplastic [Musa acuminata subsp. malaccensis]CAG1843274.1 unnamed protein product [Musa acuminata subsp. malaccensis]